MAWLAIPPIIIMSTGQEILTFGKVGSSIGHAIGGLFGGSSQPAEAHAADSSAMSQSTGTENQSNYMGCEDSAKAFTRCLDENTGPHAMNVCSWYLEQLVCLSILPPLHNPLTSFRKPASLLLEITEDISLQSPETLSYYIWQPHLTIRTLLGCTRDSPGLFCLEIFLYQGRVYVCSAI